MKTIEELAREAGIGFFPELTRFADLVLEEAAKACASESVVLSSRDQSRGALHCAATIRALKGKP